MISGLTFRFCNFVGGFAARVSKLASAALAMLALAGAPLPSEAQTAYPQRAVKIIVPFAAGGSTDVMARKIADQLSTKWSQPVIVENRPGGGTSIGGVALANAAPDGYTVMIGPDTTFAINQLLTSKPQYDPFRDYAPVTGLVEFPMAIVVNSKLPAKTLKELVELAKTKSLNYGSFGVASAPHLTVELFKQVAGVDIVHVPYKGVAPVLLALHSDEIQVSAMSPAAAGPHVKAGTLRVLAVSGEKRWPFATEIPTFGESGYPTLRAPGWWAIGVPAKTSDAIVKKLNSDFRSIIDTPDFQDYLAKLGYKSASGTPEQLAKLMKETADLWAPVIKKLGIDLK